MRDYGVGHSSGGKRAGWLFLGTALFSVCCGDAEAADAPVLAVFTSTRTQIILQWTKVPGEPLGFELQRSESGNFTDAETLNLSAVPRIYSDTGFLPDNPGRFNTTSLELGRNYYYRIRAEMGGSWSEYSNTVSASLQRAVRGVPGDLFADVVLGQPDFSQNSPGATTPYAEQTGSAILIDTNSTPERGYFVDANHNRILGFSDIHARPLVPDIVIGQPDFNHSAPNGEATLQNYPDVVPPSASTLSFARQDGLSVAETVLMFQPAVDASGNLYVPDPCNHRVLKYNDPFATDSIADEVWGQPDFSSGDPNFGGISAESLRFKLAHTHAGLTIAPDGSLWVADSGNFRVLRFPYQPGTGTISKTADLVLGQPDFTTDSPPSPPWSPFTVQVAEDGTIYVAEFQAGKIEFQLSVFEPPLTSGMPRTRILIEDPEMWHPTCLLLDPLGRGLWTQGFYSWSSSAKLLEPSSGAVLDSVDLSAWSSRGMGIDRAGNLYLHVLNDGVYEYPPPHDEADRTFLITDFVIFTGADFSSVKGAATFGDQLVVADRDRVLIWNDRHSLTTGESADDVWGQASFDVDTRYPMHTPACPVVDPKNRLWIMGDFYIGGTLELRFRAFEAPFTHDSVPVIDMANTFELVDRSGSVTTCNPSEWFSLEFADGGDQMWIPDTLNNRVLRVNNIDGGNDPSRGPYVDVVLGQHDSSSNLPNQGGSIEADTVNRPRYLSLDPSGNLYVSDNSLEGGTNWRILIFQGTLFPDDLDHVLYAVPATRVLGTGGDFTVPGCVDETCDPHDISFHVPTGIMVSTMGPYNTKGVHFPLVYLDPLTFSRPQFALGDFTSSSKHIHMDENGDLYISDYCWSRVMIYKQPFLNLNEVSAGISGSSWLAY